MRNKSGQLVIDRTIIMIIAVIVIIAVVGIFIAFNPNFLYKLIPDLAPSTPAGDEVISGVDVEISSCPNGGEVVGYIGQKNEKGSPIRMGKMGETATPFLYRPNKDGDGGEIVADDSTWWKGKFRDTVFGTVKDKVVKIDPQYLDKSNSFFNDLPYLGPQTIVLYFSALNDARLEGARFCNDKSVASGLGNPSSKVESCLSSLKDIKITQPGDCKEILAEYTCDVNFAIGKEAFSFDGHVYSGQCLSGQKDITSWYTPSGKNPLELNAGQVCCIFIYP